MFAICNAQVDYRITKLENSQISHPYLKLQAAKGIMMLFLSGGGGVREAGAR